MKTQHKINCTTKPFQSAEDFAKDMEVISQNWKTFSKVASDHSLTIKTLAKALAGNALAIVLAITLVACDGNTFTDSRDKKTYKIVTIGKQTWLAENLNWEAKGSLCYDNKPENCGKYGRLYDWNTAKTACPSGWHLPTNEEWITLIAAVGGDYSTAEAKLKSDGGWNQSYDSGTDDFGFSALPGGFGYSSGDFTDVGDSGYWWSSSETSSNNAYYRYMYGSSDYADISDYYDKNNFQSVRCVRN